MKFTPSANRVIPKILRISFSGIRELSKVPTIIAGIEPTNNHMSSMKSTLPEDTGWGLPQQQQDTRRLKKISRVRASDEEVKANSRSRSAWLRVAERLV